MPGARFGMVGHGAAIEHLLLQLRRIGPYFRMLLLRGERGTGKELAARALHLMGAGREAPFIVCDCSVIPEESFARELFGTVARATALDDVAQPGMLEAAHGGTLFLDNVGELSLAAQAILLRALQMGEVRRIGSTQARRIHTRILASTHRDLKSFTAGGFFRHDLYYRLSMVEIVLPPLRERMEDVPALAEHFREEANRHFGRSTTAFSHAALDRLVRFHWPGNIQQLRGIIFNAVMQADGDVVESFDMPTLVHAPVEQAEPEAPPVRGAKLDDVVRRHVMDVLDECSGNKLRAAEKLGISRSTLYRMLAAIPELS